MATAARDDAPSDAPVDSTSPEETPYPPIRYAWYVVGVLVVVYIFSFIDRQILNLMVDFIKEDLSISDTQMSYLMGFSFALVYTFFGIPLGRLADSTSRRRLIAIGLFFWSLMTTGCGMASRYVQFLFLRMGVGVGEATLSPSAYSLITDYFPRHKLGTAISVYSMGIYIGSGMASLLGGFVVGFIENRDSLTLPIVGDIFPWQAVFFAVGLPGMLFVFLIKTIKEPIRRGVKKIKTASGELKAVQVPIGEVLAYVGKNWRTFLCHNVGFALLSFSSYGSGAWVPTFFVRHHGWDYSVVGKVYGAIVIVFGTLGIVCGGMLADRLAKRGRLDSKMFVGFIAAWIWFPVGISYILVPNPKVAMAILALSVFTVSFPFGVAPAAIQEMMPNKMRGQASAIYLFVVNLIGLGIGPSAVAWMTDLVFKDDAKVGYSILAVSVTAHTIAMVLLFLGLKPFRRSLDHLKEWTAKNAA